jgi:hypothetical protein
LQGFAPHPTKGLKTLWNPMTGYYIPPKTTPYKPWIKLLEKIFSKRLEF